MLHAAAETVLLDHRQAGRTASARPGLCPRSCHNVQVNVLSSCICTNSSTTRVKGCVTYMHRSRIGLCDSTACVTP